jgi:hypothetical protein
MNTTSSSDTELVILSFIGISTAIGTILSGLGAILVFFVKSKGEETNELVRRSSSRGDEKS